MLMKIKSLIRLFKYLLFCRFPRIKKVYKKTAYKDLKEIIIDINFAIILDFWYEQIKKSEFNPFSDTHEDFYTWIENTVHYIENERPLLINKINQSLDEASSHISVTGDTIKLYKDYGTLSTELSDRDSQILNDLIKYRFYFWT